MSGLLHGLSSAQRRPISWRLSRVTIVPASIRALAATCCLLLCASCGKLLGSEIPADVLATCIATSTGQQTVPSDYTVKDLVGLFEDRGQISWEPEGDRSGIIRMRRTDKLNSKVTPVAFELTEQPGDPDRPACASGMSLINRMEGDGNVLEGHEAQTMLLGMLKVIPKVAGQESAAEPILVPPVSNAPAPTSAATNQLIDGCYHLNSCSYSKVLGIETVKAQGGERLLRASIEHGEVNDASGTTDDQQRIGWSGTPSTIYAFCSTRSPTIISSNGGPYMAEEFDFAGSGILGVQQNNANIYQALCHGIYDNSLGSKAASLGYQPLTEEGGRGQFIVASPEALFVGNCHAR